WWIGGSVHNIAWNFFDLPVVRIEYQKTADDPWQPVAEVAGDRGRYAWVVPMDATYDARIRVSDAWDGQPSDSSASGFTIVVPEVEAAPNPLAFGPEPKGSAATPAVTLSNPGTGTLHVTSVTTTGA